MSETGSQTIAVELEFATCTHVGMVRARNEDVIEVRPAQRWALLADGMGGYHGGEVAARLAVTAALRRLEGAAANGGAGMDSVVAVAHGLEAAVGDANAEIHRAGREHPELSGMGTTLLLVVFLDSELVCAHVGDSRLYRWRAGVLDRLTRDHTMLQEQVDGGMMSAEEARQSRYRGLLTRGLGVAVMAEPELGVHALQEGDIYLLCSDGLTDMLDDGQIADLLGDGSELAERAERLVVLANAHGGRDNVSVILARTRRRGSGQSHTG